MIKSINIEYRSENDLSEVPEEILAHPSEQMLIQVFAGTLDEARIQSVIDQLAQTFPQSALIGTTSAGEIIDGKLLENSIVINITCFEKGSLNSCLITQNDDLSLAGKYIGKHLQQDDVKALIVFGCGLKGSKAVYGEPLLHSIREHFPDAAISGGQAGEDGKGFRTLVFTRDGITENGVAAASIAGQEVIAHNAYNLSWVPIGKKMIVNKVEGTRVYEISGRTPSDIYEHYLGAEIVKQLPLSAAEFPLMIERDGLPIAVHAVGTNPDGSFDFSHQFQVGDEIRFGYCHTGLLAISAEQMRSELNRINTQTTFIYSCVARKWILDADISIELAPINKQTCSAGFFCYGEYYGRPSHAPLFLGQSMTVLCLAESDEEMQQSSLPSTQNEQPAQESRQFRTMRILHRLIETSTREIETINLELAAAARKDSLTGLANRRMFNERLASEISRLERTKGTMSLIMLDVDHFKLYNDTCGHVQGDECLREIGRTLQAAACRSIDIVARIGGDEFVVLLPETEHESALKIAKQIRASVEKLEILHQASQTSSLVTVSQGVITASIDRSAETAGMVSIADQQLYKAKKSGRNQIFNINLGSICPLD